MSKTKKPVIGGILAVFSGLFGLAGTYWYAIGFGEPGSGIGSGDMPPFVPSIIFGLPIPAVIIAVAAIVGGILAIFRKQWRWSLAGAIAALLSFLPFGIPAVVLVALSKDELS
jgi:hypothetical protein